MRCSFAVIPLLCLTASVAGADWDLLIPHEKQTKRLRLDVSIDGESPHKRWESFLDKLFAYFDHNHDGVLSVDEAKRIFPLPRDNRTQIKCDFLKMNTSKNGNVSPEEFKTYYRFEGFRPEMVKITSPSTESQNLSETLYRHLDRNGDGKLSKDELQSAWKLLRRLDEDEDETLTPLELLASVKAPTRQKVESSSLKVVPIELSNSDVLTISLGKQSTSNLMATIAGKKLEGNHSLQFNLMGNLFHVAIPENASEKLFVTSRQFYLALFKGALGSKAALDKTELTEDLTLRVLLGFFDSADRSGDGKLTLRELEEFFDLIEAGVSCQVLLTIEDHGRNLFVWFDDNGEGTLDFRKLKRAESFLPEGKSFLESKDIPSQFRISSRVGAVLGGNFGPVPIASSKKSTQPKKEKLLRGPRWFQAMDRNGDGFISRQEFIGSEDLFKEFDLDSDGQISLEEAKKAEGEK